MGGAPIRSGEDLVRAYKESGLGGEATLSAKASDAGVLGLLLAITAQRLKDLFIDPLQQKAAASNAKVHFPHLYIDLQRKKAIQMPRVVQAAIEQKIKCGERWTSVEKAHVLTAQHHLTLPYVLAYALSRAKNQGRHGGVWIPLGLSTGSIGHANAVYLQAAPSKGGPARVLVYDPNYDVDGSGSHWVHARKAVSDALPSVRRLLEGTGVAVDSQAELFGHGLQTKLGTTTAARGWFSKTVTTTQRGYPICGSVVFLVASVWLALAASSPGGQLEDILDVEGALADIVAEPAGKLATQQKIAQELKDLSHRLGAQGADPFAAAMRRKLEALREDWPRELAGGSITMSIPGRSPYTYAL